jgi:GAF domain-containing protein
MEAVHEGAQDYLVKGHIDSSLLERSIRYAIQRKRAEAALHKKERETALLAEASRLFNSSLKTGEIFDKLANLISEEIADACSIFTITHNNHLSLITAFRKGKKDTKRVEVLRKNPPTLEGSVAGSCVENREPVLIKDTYQDKRFSYYYRDTFGVKSYICVPLISKNEVLGVISTSIDSEGRSFEEDDLRFVVSIADRAAPALENAKLYENARARAQRLSVVNEISKTVTSSLTFDKVYNTIVEQLKGIIPFEFSMNIALYNPEDDTFAFSHAYDPLGTWDDFLIVGRHYKPHQLTLSKAFDIKQTLYVPDTRTMDTEYWSYLNQKSTLSLLHIPLIV